MKIIDNLKTYTAEKTSLRISNKDSKSEGAIFIVESGRGKTLSGMCLYAEKPSNRAGYWAGVKYFNLHKDHFDPFYGRVVIDDSGCTAVYRDTAKDEENNKPFPKIMRSKGITKIVVLFEEEEKGTILTSTTQAYGVGGYKWDWDMSAFEDVSGEFIIEEG